MTSNTNDSVFDVFPSVPGARDAVALLNARPLKDLEPAELAVALVAAVEDASALSRRVVRTAIVWASIAHAGQTRAARGRHAITSYLEHPLRCALRLHRAGVTDPVTLVAAVLHDVIEDGCPELATMSGYETLGLSQTTLRRLGADMVAETFGADVANAVLAVTNPLRTAEEIALHRDHPELRDMAYVSHLEQVLVDERATLVKVSDFLDNAGSLHHTPALTNVPAKARKYLAASGVLLSATGRHVDDQHVRAELLSGLSKTIARLRSLAV